MLLQNIHPLMKLAVSVILQQLLKYSIGYIDIFSASQYYSEVRCRTGQPPITTLIKQRRIKLFGHVARADQAAEHSHALQASPNLLSTRIPVSPENQ